MTLEQFKKECHEFCGVSLSNPGVSCREYEGGDFRFSHGWETITFRDGTWCYMFNGYAGIGSTLMLASADHAAKYAARYKYSF